jgi:hypothetical protein
VRREFLLLEMVPISALRRARLMISKVPRCFLKEDGGPVFGGGCSSGRQGWGLVWWLRGGGGGVVNRGRRCRGGGVAVAVAPDGP